MKSTDDLQLNNINKRRESKTIYKDKENSKKKKEIIIIQKHEL